MSCARKTLGVVGLFMALVVVGTVAAAAPPVVASQEGAPEASPMEETAVVEMAVGPEGQGSICRDRADEAASGRLSQAELLLAGQPCCATLCDATCGVGEPCLCKRCQVLGCGLLAA